MDKVGKVLVIGGGIGGMEASLNLVEAGFGVYLADEKPNIGGSMAALDKTFPTNDCSMCIMAPKLVEVGRNPNIELLMNTEVVAIEGEAGNFTVTLKRRPRRVLPERCTSCSLCAPNCPLEVGSEYNENLSKRSAAFINFPQAIPSTYMVDRLVPPCNNRCPVNLNARDYVGLIAEGRFFESLDLIRERLPFPGTIGRICNHPCEDECLRGRKVEEPIAICALKRFVADYEVGKRDMPIPVVAVPKGKTVGIVGGGPAGLTAAIELKKAGYEPVVYESQEKLGGMLYWGIPAYRLPKDVLDRETSLVERMGISVKRGVTIGKDIALKELQARHDAVFIGCGAQGWTRLGIENEDTGGVVSGMEFLMRSNKGEAVETGARVGVVGGGNVAIDAARSALRLGAKEVHIFYRRSRSEMPALDIEIEEAEQEGIKIHYMANPKRVLVGDNGRIRGIDVQWMRITGIDASGRRSTKGREGKETFFALDMLISAIGQAMDTDFIKDIEGVGLTGDGKPIVDPITLETAAPGIFAGGDVVTGPRMAIDAVAQGQRAAESIIRYFEGKDLKAGRYAREDELVEDVPERIEKRNRVAIPALAPDKRQGFIEVESALSEGTARAEAERCLNCRRCLGCKLCQEVCKPEAIDYTEEASEEKVVVGSVIIATGFDEYDANAKRELGYGLYPNVVTSIEFERILSATGPTGSIVMRPSDGRIPGKIAFIQCVGSRDKINEYCSSVCCMYATKEAVIAKEHQSDIEPSIFYMDIRAYGKGFDQYYERAKNEHGVRYVKSAVSRVLEDVTTRDLEIVYVDEDGELKSEIFDMVVLSVGLRPPKHLRSLAGVLGVSLNKYGFVETSPMNPLATSRPGIYVSGASESPKDIPETVMQATGAACEAASVIADVRGKDLVSIELPAEKQVDAEEPRIGVFVCNCGVNIGGVVNVPEVRDYAATLPNVVLADENLFSCSQDTQDKMKKLIDDYNINRVVVASCSPRTHEPLFRSTIREAGLNKYLFEMANIRDQCSWVHMQDKKGATEKAKDLVRMAVTNANFIKPLKDVAIDVDKKALVVGGGMAGMTAALKLAGQNFEVFLVEKENVLGGNLRHIYHTLEGVDIPALLTETLEKVTSHPLVHVITGSTVVDHHGYKGNFESVVAGTTTKEKTTINHGVIIVATGGEEFKPAGMYGYGETGVMTQTDLEKMIAENAVPPITRCTMIQCVGSRDEERPYCSRVCCSVAVKNAIDIKEKSPDTDVVIFYRDIRTYGFLERHYLRARNLGVRFIRFEAESAPVVEKRDGRLYMECFDASIGEKVAFATDIVVLSAGIVPSDNHELATLFKVPRTNEGFFFEAHMKLRPVDFASDGMFLCGLAHSPKNIQETIAQAEGAVARAITILSKDKMAVGGIVARVEPEKCAACLTCVRACPYSVPVINAQGDAEIDISKCKGCGVCVAECPALAIELMHYQEGQLIEKTRSFCAHGTGIVQIQEKR